MAKVTPDFNERSLPPGTYRARILSCEMKQSKKGTNYLNWKLETIDEEYPNQWIYMMTGMTGKGAQKFKELVQAAYDPSYEGGEIDTDLLLNCEILITIDRGLNQDGTESKYMQVLSVARATADEEF